MKSFFLDLFMFTKVYIKFFIFLMSFLLIISCDNASNNDSIACDDFSEIELSSFSLLDLNETSSTYDELINIEIFTEDIKLFYFSDNEN